MFLSLHHVAPWFHLISFVSGLYTLMKKFTDYLRESGLGLDTTLIHLEKLQGSIKWVHSKLEDLVSRMGDDPGLDQFRRELSDLSHIVGKMDGDAAAWSRRPDDVKRLDTPRG